MNTHVAPVLTLLTVLLIQGASIADEPSENWITRYAGPDSLDDKSVGIAIDATGCVFVTGVTETGPYYADDYATVKYDPSGLQQWLATYNGPGDENDAPHAIAVDASGNVLVTGGSQGESTEQDYATVMYDPNGDLQWVARYNGPGNDDDNALAIAVDSAGNSYVTGYSAGVGTGMDFATVKYNSEGEQQWVARYNGPENNGDEACAIAVDGLGNVYVAGNSQGDSAEYCYTTVKYDSGGIEQWVAFYHGPVSYSSACAIAVDEAGNVFVTGTSTGVDTSNDYATVKYDSQGGEQWVARYNSPVNGDDDAQGLAIDQNGNVFVTGQSWGSSVYDYATVKYNSEGEQQWAVRYSGPGNGIDSAGDIALDSAGNSYVTGYSKGDETSYDYATIKYSPSGEQQWVVRYDGPASSQDLAQSIALDPSGNICVTGRSTGTGSDFDFATVMYSSTSGITLDEILFDTGVVFNAAPSPVYYTAELSVTLPEASHCELQIFDISGRQVETLQNGFLPEGPHAFTWQASRFAPGVYLLRVSAGSQEASLRLVVLR